MKGSDEDTSLRGWLALAALLVFLITLGIGVCLVGTKRWNDAKDFLSLVLPVELGLLFTVGRYYFSRADRRPRKDSETRKR